LAFDLVVEPLVACMLFLELREEGFVAAFWIFELFVENAQHARWLLLDEVKDYLIVDVVRRFERNLLRFIEFFFEFERVVVEMLLKFLVCLIKLWGESYMAIKST